MTFDSIITIAAFCCYLIFMLCIGMYFVGKTARRASISSAAENLAPGSLR